MRISVIVFTMVVVLTHCFMPVASRADEAPIIIVESAEPNTDSSYVIHVQRDTLRDGAGLTWEPSFTTQTRQKSYSCVTHTGCTSCPDASNIWFMPLGGTVIFTAFSITVDGDSVSSTFSINNESLGTFDILQAEAHLTGTMDSTGASFQLTLSGLADYWPDWYLFDWWTPFEWTLTDTDAVWQDGDLVGTFQSHFVIETYPENCVYFKYEETCNGPASVKVEGFVITILDGTSSHNPILNKEFEFIKVTNDPPTMTEALKGTLTTNTEGKVILPMNWFAVGDTIKIRRSVHVEPARKHQLIMPNMFYVSIDNGKFNTNTGAIYYDTLTAETEQTVIVDHTTVIYDLVVSVEWDADEQYLENLRDGFKYASNYLYDVTDGQMHLNKVAIFDDAAYWDDADVQVFATNWLTPEAYVGGIGSGSGTIHFPRKWFGNQDATRNSTYSEFPLIFTSSTDFRTKCHEFSHYGLSFYDEYMFVNGGRCAQTANFGFMDYQYDNREPYASEMSSDARYMDGTCRNTEQYFWRGAPCWTDFQAQVETKPYEIFTPIITPSERQLPPGYDYFEGPNNNFSQLNYDVGSHLSCTISNPSDAARVLIVRTHKPKVDVTLKKAVSGRIIRQGKTADEERIRCLGVDLGDKIEVNGKEKLVDRLAWWFGQIVVGATGMSRLSNYYRTSLDGDSVEVIMRKLQGDYPLLNSGTFLSENTLAYSLVLDKSFAQNPSLEFYPRAGQPQSYTFSQVPSGYQVTLGDSLSSDGMFSVIAVDDSGYTFFMNNNYILAKFSDSLISHEISGPEGRCVLNLDTANASWEKIFILSSDFPPPLNGLDSLVEQGGSVHSICAYPGTSTLSGEHNYLTIRYSNSDLKNSSPYSLKIFRWNEVPGQWVFVGGNVDTLRNEISECIQSLGIYAAFSTALLRGDVDKDGGINISDAVYLIAYIFTDGPAPDPLILGDVDCDRGINLSDVVYLINYIFTGGPPPCGK